MTTLGTETNRPLKLLLIGDAGGGKTGALASLANAGLKLFIWDFDNGLDVLRHFVKPEHFKNVHYQTLTDKVKPSMEGSATPIGPPTAFVRALRLFERWKEDDEDFGSVYDWDTSRVVVIDSLTHAGHAAMRLRLANTKRTGKPPRIQDWGVAAGMQRSILETLYSDSVKCHVIVTAHLKLIEPNTIQDNDDEDDFLGIGSGKNPNLVAGKKSSSTASALGIFPSALGKALPPEVGSYFNTALRARTVNNKKVLETMPADGIELKNPIPTVLNKQLPLGDGLAKFFELVQKG